VRRSIVPNNPASSLARIGAMSNAKHSMDGGIRERQQFLNFIRFEHLFSPL